MRRADAPLLASRGPRRRTARRAAGQAGARAGAGFRAVPRRARPARAARPRLPAPRRRPRLRPPGGWRPALPVPWLAVRCRRQVPGDAGRTGRQRALPEGAPAQLSGGGEERHRLRLSRRRRSARLPRLRLLPGARHARLRLQGPDRVQLAAGAGGRHRSRARLLPAPLLRGRGYRRGLRQAVPLRLRRFRNPDDPPAARVPAAEARRRGDRLRPAPLRAAQAERAAHACARDQPRLPLRLRDPDERGDDDHAVARADRRYELLLVRDLHQLR